MSECGACCRGFARFILIFVNFKFLLLGLLMLSFGIVMVAAPDKISQLVTDNGGDLTILGDARGIIKNIGIFMIVLGCFIANIGFFGFFGACGESQSLLIIYLVLVIIILLAQIAIIIFVTCFPNTFQNFIQSEMNKTLIANFTEAERVYPNVSIVSSSLYGYYWASMQFGAQCCGVHGPQDYNGSRYSSDQRKVQLGMFTNNFIIAMVPVSCCKLKDGVKFPGDIKDQNSFTNLTICLETGTMEVNTKSCYSRIAEIFSEAADIAIGVASGIIGLQVIIIIYGIVLVDWIHKRQYIT